MGRVGGVITINGVGIGLAGGATVGSPADLCGQGMSVTAS